VPSWDTLIAIDGDQGIVQEYVVLGRNEISVQVYGLGMAPRYKQDPVNYKVGFDKQSGEWRVIGSSGSAPEQCKKRTPVSTNNTRDLTMTLSFTSRHKLSAIHAKEQTSVGEFALSSINSNFAGCNVKIYKDITGDTNQCEIPAVALYSDVNGKRIGSMRAAIYNLTQWETSVVEAWLLARNGLSIAEPTMVLRRKGSPSLLAFGEAAGNDIKWAEKHQNKPQWINVSPNRHRPAWINLAELPNELARLYATREEIAADADEVKLKSRHNVRTGPSTSNKVISVIEKGDNFTYSMKVVGDWMMVHHISPFPSEHMRTQDFSKLDSNYVQVKGWLKWREQDKGVRKEYVGFEHWYGI